jgi:hypothetical protein
MEVIVVNVLLGAVVVAIVAAPLLLPWPMRLRWLLASPPCDPMVGVAFWPRATMTEAQIVGVAERGELVEVTLAELPGPRSRTFVAHRRDAGFVARLEGWCTAREPLLLLRDESGDVTLGGPDGAVTGLRDVSELV